MAAPLSLAAVFDQLPIASVEWSIQRNDEFSGIGSGDVWQAELADPLWTADVILGDGLHDELKQVAARIRALDGSRVSFLMCDPLSLYPQADPGGLVLGAAAVTIRAVDSDRRVALLQGLPAGYVLTIGDKLQITQGEAIRFFEVAATVAAAGTGEANVSVFPRLPLSLAPGATVTLIRPACPVIIQPNTHKPGVGRRGATRGAAFRVLQKKRS
ncbi:hypothetical protein RHAB21_00725 [Pseudorhizobium halotolerans]|uniref:Hint domain-containing protein n=1 Tax=Pseudorhizobium halotolerans TaxID=1233081 RepID=A0ABM8PYY8_9HYPH|nr:hypothetical protein [Pseudorhizobium halotolerans]CAD7055475.1 hypothetical protein RHAB21_00725 [Pseudorhizobium halotolerans]